MQESSAALQNDSTSLLGGSGHLHALLLLYHTVLQRAHHHRRII